MSKAWWKEKSETELEDIRRRKSESLRKYWRNLSTEEYLEVANKISKSVKKQYAGISDAEKAVIGQNKSEGQIKRWRLASDEAREKFGLISSEINRARWNRASEEYRRYHGKKVSEGQSSLNLSEGQRTKWRNLPREEYEATCRRMSESRIKYFLRLTPEERQEIRWKVTLPERLLGIYLEDKFPGQWAYNGNFSQGVIIGRRIPDFVNLLDNRNVIEVFGGLGHWHFLGDEVEKIEYYAKYDVRCLVVWEWDCYSYRELDTIFGKETVNEISLGV